MNFKFTLSYSVRDPKRTLIFCVSIIFLPPGVNNYALYHTNSKMCRKHMGISLPYIYESLFSFEYEMRKDCDLNDLSFWLSQPFFIYTYYMYIIIKIYLCLIHVIHLCLFSLPTSFIGCFSYNITR